MVMPGRKGIAQLVVLWALMLLGTLAMSFSFAMRTEALAARNGLDAARAYYQARTGINRAIALLSFSFVDNVLMEPLAGREEDASYETWIVNEGGKIDINLVSERTLKEILGNGGLSQEDAGNVGDAILDWRDQDDMPRAGGAESAYYDSLPEPVKIRNGKLAALDELLAVKGVTPDLYTRLLSRVFTVHGSSPLVDVNSAPLEVLLALPGFTQQAADALIALRRQNPFRTPAEVTVFLAGQGIPLAPVPMFSTAQSSQVYTIASVGKAGEKIARSVECQVKIGAGGPKSVKILRWADYVAIGEGTDR
jgi:general secretion pathway protein K